MVAARQAEKEAGGDKRQTELFSGCHTLVHHRFVGTYKHKRTAAGFSSGVEAYGGRAGLRDFFAKMKYMVRQIDRNYLFLCSSGLARCLLNMLPESLLRSAPPTVEQALFFCPHAFAFPGQADAKRSREHR